MAFDIAGFTTISIHSLLGHNSLTANKTDNLGVLPIDNTFLYGKNREGDGIMKIQLLH